MSDGVLLSMCSRCVIKINLEGIFKCNNSLICLVVLSVRL